MKIVYVITKANWGGAQKYVYELAIAAKSAGNEVAVAYGEPGVLVQKLDEAGISYHCPSPCSKRSNLRGSGRRISRAPRTARKRTPRCRASQQLARERSRSTRRTRSWHRSNHFYCARMGIQRTAFVLAKVAYKILFLAHDTALAPDYLRVASDSPRRRALPFHKNKLMVIHNGIKCTEQRARADARAALLPGQEKKYWSA